MKHSASIEFVEQATGWVVLVRMPQGRRRQIDIKTVVKAYICRRRFRFTVGMLCGFLLAVINATLDTKSRNAHQRTAESKDLGPFRVPGPDALCPSHSHPGDGARIITFIESSGEECLTPRQACGVESAARAHPQTDVRLIFNSKRVGPPSWDHRILRSGRVRSCLLNDLLAQKYSNVETNQTDFVELLRSTPYGPLIESGRLQNQSSWPVVHISDAVRLVLLEKHGGVYLDFDNIVFRPLHCLRNTFSFLEEHPNIENSVLMFDAGHEFLKFLIPYTSQFYDPKDRLSLGPPTIAKAFNVFCKMDTLKAGQFQCENNATVSLIHPDAFFPVRHYQNHYFYSSDLDGFDERPMERAYLTHVYMSSWGTKVRNSSLYGRMARHYCPAVWNLTYSEAIPLGF